jgi:hypothetical protein
VVLRRASNAVLFTTRQVRTVLALFKFVPTQAEAFVIMFRRTVDWHGLASVLFDVPSAVVEVLRRRLGVVMNMQQTPTYLVRHCIHDPLAVCGCLALRVSGCVPSRTQPPSGAANLFDYGAAVGHYEIDLAIPEERHVMLTLLKCGVEEPGMNMADTAPWARELEADPKP